MRRRLEPGMDVRVRGIGDWPNGTIISVSEGSCNLRNVVVEIQRIGGSGRIGRWHGQEDNVLLSDAEFYGQKAEQLRRRAKEA